MSDTAQLGFFNCPRCGATYLRPGECPALCEPPPVKPPKYTGPPVVGRTHTSRLAAPVYAPDGWIGLPPKLSDDK